MGVPDASAPPAPMYSETHNIYPPVSSVPLMQAGPPPAYAATSYPQPSQPFYSAIPAVQPVIVSPMIVRFGENPMQMQCPSCQASILTRTTYRSGVLTWLAAGAICLFGCWLGCQFIPFCIDGCMDVDHRCPNCNMYLGTYKRI